MKEWKTNDDVIHDTAELAKHTVYQLADIAQQRHIPFRDLGEYIDIFIKVMFEITTMVLLQMCKDRQEDIDMVENFNFDEDE